MIICRVVWIMFEEVSVAEVLSLSITDTEPAMVSVSSSLLHINIIITLTRGGVLTLGHMLVVIMIIEQSYMIADWIIAGPMFRSIIHHHVSTHGLLSEALLSCYVGILTMVTQDTTASSHWRWRGHVTLIIN